VNLIKTSFYTSISTAITFLSGFIVIKVVAVKIGPEGIAFVGQFQNTTAILTLLATGAITMGVIKYLAQHKTEPLKVQKIIHSAFLISFFCSLIISVIVLSSSHYLSRAAFKTTEYWLVYFLFGLFVMLISFNTLFLAILNGLKEIKKYTLVNISASLIGVSFTLLGAFYFGLIGVLISSTASGIVVFVMNVFIFKKLGISWKPRISNWDKEVFKMLLAFSVMALVSGFIAPAIQILIRDKMILRFSATEAGYWQAVTKISDYYLGFITSVLAVYYMPRLSEIQDRHELKTEIKNGYKIILPIVGLVAFAIWLFKDLIIHLLFTPQFLPMRPLFAFQLMGDFFKIGSWLLAYLMIAKAMTKTFIITEIFFSLSYVVLSYIFLNKFGIIGATYSFCINYAIYWVVMYMIMKKRFL